MRVLHICPALGSGGIERLIIQWYEAAKKNSIEFVFAVYAVGGETYDFFTSIGAHIYKIPRIKNVGFGKYSSIIKKIICVEKIDIVHTNSGPLTWVALRAAKKKNVKMKTRRFFLYEKVNTFVFHHKLYIIFVM